MVKKEKNGNTSGEKTIGALKKEVAKKGKEIEELQKSVAEMRTQIQKKDKIVDPPEPDKMVDGLMNVGFGLLGSSNAANGQKAKGLLGLVDELGKLAEKTQMTQTTQKRINFGKGGVVDFRVSSRPIKGGSSLQPASRSKIGTLIKQSSSTYAPMPLAAGTIKERELIVDIFEEEDCLHVMVELPNVKENEISLDVEGNTLTIKAGTQNKEYFKKVELPATVEKKIVESSCRNGILEVRLKKKTIANQTK